MTSIDVIQKELEDIELKLSSARKAAAAPEATEKDKADLKLIEQEYLAAQAKARRGQSGGAGKAEDQPSDPKKKLDKKLDEALKGSFPGSDPVAFVEAAPIKEHDRSLPDVKLAEQQHPKKTQAAKETAKRRGK